jgi:DNA-binding LacI/PurR family transcriptional regulator
MIPEISQNVLVIMCRASSRDVAKKSGLSITTVFRALDGYDDVAEQTRDKWDILQTGPRANYVARSQT